MMNADDQELHLSDLALQFRDQSGAVEAAILMEDLRKGKLTIDIERLLRHHDTDPISHAREIRLRDSFDLLLAFYSILELASIVRYIPEQLPERLRQQAQYDLTHPAVRNYYELHYPLPLPQLFRRRLANDRPLFEQRVDGQAHSCLLAFLSLESRARDDRDMKTLLWFLDSGWIDGYSISDTLSVLRSPEDTAACLMKPSHGRNPLDQSISGFSKLIFVCVELDGILERCSEYRLLQSGIWHYYGWWFDRANAAIGQNIKGAIEAVLGWNESQPDADYIEEQQERRQEIQAAKIVVERLTSGVYRHALAAAHEPATEPALGSR